jgi:hypothetical protein
MFIYLLFLIDIMYLVFYNLIINNSKTHLKGEQKWP